ncbi:Glutathione S-transferase [Marinobacter segnicrescens]|uniref:Glutathione S-transferase n=1 Tax=Marinobacter segnicrescens TaxID=430453 RepID=A0A1I0I512_9GAMM|nr:MULTISPECIES: glutathione S-transferase [Marinobacter]SET91624.1 Glutathione S-transferase [Marinobacter segnicrescens]
MKIYETEGFPNPLRVRIALAEKGATDKVVFVPVDVMGGEHRTSDFRAKNPDATVPVLELDDGTCIAQCNAITEYLDGVFDGPSLTGASPKERAVIAMMNIRAESGLMNAVGAYFHHATQGLGPDLETWQCPDWGNKQKEVAQSTMAYLNEVLAENEFLAGDRFTVADITAYAGLVFAEFAKVDIPGHLDHLLAWRARVAARPSITG